MDRVERISFLRFAARAVDGLAACAAIALPADAYAQAERVEWDPDWPRFRKAEIAFTAGMSLQFAAAIFLYPDPYTRWQGGILFDDAAREALRLPTRSGREKAQLAGDVLFYGLIAYPLVVDTLVVTAGFHGSGDVALQMTAMNLESVAFVGAIALSFEKLGRERPSAQACREDPDYAATCEDGANLNEGLLSGHSAAAFAGAGLTCAHHTNLPLYGAADIAACVLSLAAAGSVGTLRVMSDDHYATDIVLGGTLGLFGGYGLPVLLHYGFDARGGPTGGVLPTFRAGSGATMLRGVLAPIVARNQVGVTLVGSF